MIIDIRVRKCQNIQFDDIHLSKAVELLLEKKDCLLCIYKGDEYYTNIEYSQLTQISSDIELLDYINKSSFHGWVEGLDINKICELFYTYKEIVSILIGQPDNSMSEVLTISRQDVIFGTGFVDYSIYMNMRLKGVKSYIVNFPVNIKNVFGPFCAINLGECYLQDSNIKKRFENDVKRITDYTYDEYVFKLLEKNRENWVDDGTQDARTIFLVGPCIVAGTFNSEISMVDFLREALRKKNYPYRIVKIDSRYYTNKLLEYDICANDIVIFMGCGLSYKDFDITEVYERYKGTKSLCTNFPMHVSVAGSKLVADAVMADIITPCYDMSESAEDTLILHHAEERQLTCETEYEVKMYLERTDIPRGRRKGNNGAIVMNANPFTLGHRGLVEYASKRVDNLYIFVVEENASYFTFKERFEMVMRGTKDIENAIIVPSGNFIISQKTFCGYFSKDTDSNQIIDASTDIYIFARYIVPYFHIRKRFVGDEPTDKITAQYNEQMKKILPNYGCDLIEITRFERDNKIISGSKVREALSNKNLNYLRDMLPKSSLEYIEKNIEKFQGRELNRKREEKLSLCMTDRLKSFYELVKFIKKRKRIIIYGISIETKALMKVLDDEVKEKILFVDKRAEDKELIFMGKNVMAPCKLEKGYIDYDIVILSSKFYKEIYYACIDMGIGKERIRYNPYDLCLRTEM